MDKFYFFPLYFRVRFTFVPIQKKKSAIRSPCTTKIGQYSLNIKLLCIF